MVKMWEMFGKEREKKAQSEQKGAELEKKTGQKKTEMGKEGVDETKTSEQIYDEALSYIKTEFKRADEGKSPILKEATHIVEKIVQKAIQEDKTIIDLTKRETPQEYYLAHSVNVCILAINLGFTAGDSRDELIEMGRAALLYDIGMIKVAKIAQQARKLEPSEMAEVKKHAAIGSEIINKAEDSSESLIEAAHNHHERFNGKGYPIGLTGEKLSEYTKLIGMVDVYEALTHTRKWRDKISSGEALRIIIEARERDFDPEQIKHLISVLTIYPAGTFVELNSGEIGKVVRVNKDSPLRPVVKVIYDARGNELKEPKEINLRETSIVHVKKTITGGLQKS